MLGRDFRSIDAPWLRSGASSRLVSERALELATCCLAVESPATTLTKAERLRGCNF